MKKSNLKEIYTYINQTTEKEVDFESIDLPNHKIKHIIIGNKKTIQTKKQSSMTTKQFQEFVIEFIKRQEEFNKMILERLDNIEHRLTNVENDVKLIKSCPTIKRELNFK